MDLLVREYGFATSILSFTKKGYKEGDIYLEDKMLLSTRIVV